MQPLYLALGTVLVGFLAVLFVVRKLARQGSTAFNELSNWQAERSDLLSELLGARTAVLEWREKAGRLEGQRDELEKTAVSERDRLAEQTRKMEAAETRITDLTRAHAGAATGLLNSQERVAQLTEDVSRKAAELTRLGTQLLELNNENTKSEANLASALRANEEMKAFLTSAHTELSAAVAKIAGEAFAQKSQELQTSLQNSHLQSRSDLETLLKPFAEKVGEFRGRVEQLYGEEALERSRLTGAVTQLTAVHEKMTEETAALTRALKGNPKSRGDYGELMLETVLRSSGLQDGTHYFRQPSITDESGARLRPDIIVKLPDSRQVVVDSKLNLLAWHEAMNCNDDQEAYKAALREHAKALRVHVKELGERNYPKRVGSAALEVTIAFIAIEGALAGALGADPNLQTYAFERGVVFASPNTLMATLVVVERLWSRDKIARLAKEIGECGGKVLDAVIKFVEDFDEIGKRLGKATEAFAVAKSSLYESQQGVLARSRRLAELGVSGRRTLPEQLRLDDSPDAPASAALTEELARLAQGEDEPQTSSSILSSIPGEVLGADEVRA